MPMPAVTFTNHLAIQQLECRKQRTLHATDSGAVIPRPAVADDWVRYVFNKCYVLRSVARIEPGQGFPPSQDAPREQGRPSGLG
jgi:hypothetical protein